MSYPEDFGFFILFFLAPLLYLIRRGELKKTHYFFIFFSIWFSSLFSTFWIAETYPLEWAFLDKGFLPALIIFIIWSLFSLSISLPLVLCLFFGVRNIFKYFSGAASFFLIPALFVVLEWGRATLFPLVLYGPEVILGPHYTYYSLAYAAYSIPGLNQLFSVGGLYLVSFYIIICNLFLSYPPTKKSLARGGGFLLLSGALIFFTLPKEDITPKEVKLFNFHTNLPPQRDDTLFRSHQVLEKINTIQKEGGIIVLPENFNIPSLAVFKELYPGNVIVSSYPSSEGHLLFFKKTDDFSNVFFYKKQLLMPVGEYKISLLHFVVNLFFKDNPLELLEKTYTAKGGGSSVYNLEGVTIGASLCSENISPLIFRDFSLAGADIFINIASLAPFHNSQMLARQTLAINTVRALENGKYFIVSSNFSPSYIISPSGKIVEGSFMNSSDKVSFKEFSLSFYPQKTFYSQRGDYIIVMSIIGITLLLLWRKNEV